MSFFDKVKQSAGQAAEQVKGEVTELKLKNEIVRTYEDLGRKAFELVDKGELENASFDPYVTHIRDLRAKLEASEQAGWEK